MDVYEVYVLGFCGVPRFTRVYASPNRDVAIKQYDKYRMKGKYSEVVLFKLPEGDVSKAKILFRYVRG